MPDRQQDRKNRRLRADLRAVAVQLVAIGLAVLTARLIYKFGIAVEPQVSPLRQALMATVFGAAGHVGLFLSAHASSRPVMFRRLVFVSMLPASAAFVGATVDSVQRLYRGDPLSGPVMCVYAVGLVTYAIQLLFVMRPVARAGEGARAA